MDDPELERLQALRSAALLLRFPVLVAGVLLALYAVVSLLSAGLSVAPFFFVVGSSFASSTLLLMGGLLVLGLLSTAVDALGAGLLLHSAALGFAARADPTHLPRSMRSLQRFWVLLLFRLAVAVLSTVSQPLLFGLVAL